MKTFIASTAFAAIAAFALMPAAQAGEIWRATGFEQPESALVDAAHNRIVVSNMVGGPSKADGNGYLSLLSMDGKIITRHWVDGMDAPKGMAVSGGKLYAADITKVRIVDLASGKLVSSIDIPGAVFLNDMTQDSEGRVYVSDMLTDTIYRIDGEKPELFVKDPLLASPNGVFADGNRLIVASWGKGIKADFSTAEPGGLLSIDLATKTITPLPGAQKFGDLDGVVAIGDTIYATANPAGKLYRYRVGGTPEVVATLKPGCADIDTDGKRIFVPQMNEGEVVALTID